MAKGTRIFQPIKPEGYDLNAKTTIVKIFSQFITIFTGTKTIAKFSLMYPNWFYSQSSSTSIKIIKQHISLLKTFV